MRLRLTRSIPGISRKGELKGNTLMDGAALDRSPAKVLRAMFILNGSPCSAVRSICRFLKTPEKIGKTLSKACAPWLPFYSHDFFGHRQKDHGHFLSQFAECYASRNLSISVMANRIPLLPIGMLVAFSGVRVKPKLEQRAAACCSRQNSGRTGGCLSWLKTTETFLNYSKASCHLLRRADMAVRSERPGYQNPSSRTP